jgi:hypothetical protein
MRTPADEPATAGCVTNEISIPWRNYRLPIWAPLRADGAYYVSWLHAGVGSNHERVYPTSLIDPMSRLRERAAAFPHTIRVLFLLVLGHYAGVRRVVGTAEARKGLRDRLDVLPRPVRQVVGTAEARKGRFPHDQAVPLLLSGSCSCRHYTPIPPSPQTRSASRLAPLAHLRAVEDRLRIHRST